MEDRIKVDNLLVVGGVLHPKGVLPYRPRHEIDVVQLGRPI